MSKKKAPAKKQQKGKAAKKQKIPNLLLVTWLGVILATWISAGGLISSIEYLTAKSVSQQTTAIKATSMGNSASDLFKQRFQSTQSLLDNMATQDEVYNALALDDVDQLDYLTDIYKSSIQYADALRIIPWDRLGTAGLKQRNIELRNNVEIMMLTKTDNGETPTPEVYPEGKQWLTSFAAPIKQDDAVIGIILLTMKNDYLKNIILSDYLLQNGLFVISHNRGKTILRSGKAGEGNSYKTSLPFSGGTLTTYVDPSVETQFKDTFTEVYIFIAGTTLALTIFALLGYIATQRAIKKDCNALQLYASALAGLHETQKPMLNMRELIPLAKTMDELGIKIKRSAVNLESGESAPQIVVKETNKSASPDNRPQVAEVVESTAFAHPEIFRDYDIRGIADEQLDDDSAFQIGKAIGSEAMKMGLSNIVIANDCRNSSERIKKAVGKGICSTGCHITDIGMSPTPALYFAAEKLGTQAGVMITGSHNPAQYNGVKIVLGGASLQGERIQQLLQRIDTGDFIENDEYGQQSISEVADEYVNELCNDIITAKPLKVVIDAANGVGGAIAIRALEQLDCEVIPINCDANGNFPAEGPDPTIASNLQELVATVTGQQADLGIAFDGDADRLVAVAPSGKILNGDQLLMIFAQDIVTRNPGCNVVYDIKSSSNIGKIINQFGGRPIVWKSGHSNIKAKMQETDALLGAELTGHYFFKERWFGFDDGIYAAMRLVELLTTDDRTLDDRISDFPQTISTPELSIPLASEAEKNRLMASIATALSREQGEVTDIDGIRIDYDGAWGLVRPSNTSTKLSLRFEASSDDLMNRIQQVFKAAILSADENLDLPF